MEIKEAAKLYHKLGLSVIPVASNKQPRESEDAEHEYSWKKHQSKLIEPNGSFDRAYGVALVCGKVSGNLEIIDIDLKNDLNGNVFKELKDLIHAADPNLLKKLTVEKSPSGGYHFIYRCVDEVQRNAKLANRHTTEQERTENPKIKQKCILETRGEGGYFACYPTKGYELLYGGFDRIPVLTAYERQVILDCARSFNTVFATVPEKKEYIKIITENKSPFDDWNERGDILELLQVEGWKLILRKGAHNFLLRPGSEHKWSADWHDEKRLFYVWSTGSEFDNDKAYNPTQVLSYLRFNKDYSATAKWLLSEGYGERPERAVEMQKVKSSVSITDGNFDFIALDADINKYLEQWRNGTFVKGVSTGIPSLDKHFLLKRGNFNIINGKDNVGKSVFMWYLLLLSAMFHGWRWVIYSNENRPGTVIKRMIEFYYGQKIDKISDSQFMDGNSFVKKHFTIISNDTIFNFKDILNICEKLLLKSKYDGALLDPYNSLKIDLNVASKLSTHEYHYEAASEMQTFTKRNDFCIYLNCHVVTFAARENKAPGKADTEGGSKFPNKADDFLTFHRYTNGENWRDMEIHVRKIKELETGGSYTYEDNPFKLRMMEGQCGYEDMNGYNPIAEYWKGKGTQYQIPIVENNNPIPQNLNALKIGFKDEDDTIPF